jgi:U2 small nuclear ribonucleoprotein B''
MLLLTMRFVPSRALSELYVLCSQFGAVLDVVALKTPKMRGQAFVVFQHLTSASVALQKLQGFEFYGKPLRIAYGKSKSDAVAKEDGSFVPKHKRKAVGSVADFKQPQKKDKPGDKAEEPAAAVEDAMEEDAEEQPPNQILFLQRLPAEVNEVMLQALFKQFNGLQEVRMVPGKTGIAFVEFENDAQATQAKDTLQGFKLTPQHAMKITFAKKN